MKIAAFLVWCLSATALLADGGVLIGQETSGDMTVSVFAAPTPLRAGPVDVSVLLQREGVPLTDGTMKVHIRKDTTDETPSGPGWVPPCCRMTFPPEMPMPIGHSANRLLYGNWISLPESGRWLLDFAWEVDGQAHEIQVELEVAPPMPPALAYWPYLFFPVGASAVFGLNLLARRRRTESR